LEIYKRLVIAQDTGSAINGVVRGDIFFGGGERAEQIASHMKQDGVYFILIPKNMVKE